MNRVAVLGHFGFGHQYLDGQTVKTKIIAKELDNRFGENKVVKIDTHGAKVISVLKAPFQAVKALKKAKNVIIFPAHNGVRIFAPLLVFFGKFFKNRKLHYVVIGGWLPKFLQDKPKLQKKLKKFDCIYVETNTMKNALDSQGFENVVVMPNCKDLNISDVSELVYPNGMPYKLCTFSRVMKEKGIEIAVDAVKAFNEKAGKTVFSLDIFGQIDYGQTEWFESLRQTFPSCIVYCGLVDYDKSVDTLKNYFALLFPTYYEGEGFAGTVLDALAAGVPIIASDWKYNSEIITEDVGVLFEAKSTDGLVGALEYVSGNIQSFLAKKKNCLEKAKQYIPKVALSILFENLETDKF